MYDFEKVENNFHAFLKERVSEEALSVTGLPKIDEELFGRQYGIDVPFGSFMYFLTSEKEKPVLYVRGLSRMDLDLDKLWRIDEESCEFIENGSYEQKRDEHNIKRSVRDGQVSNGL